MNNTNTLRTGSNKTIFPSQIKKMIMVFSTAAMSLVGTTACAGENGASPKMEKPKVEEVTPSNEEKTTTITKTDETIDPYKKYRKMSAEELDKIIEQKEAAYEKSEDLPFRERSVLLKELNILGDIAWEKRKEVIAEEKKWLEEAKKSLAEINKSLENEHRSLAEIKQEWIELQKKVIQSEKDLTFAKKLVAAAKWE